MRLFVLTAFFLFTALFTRAQESTVSSLPAGKYEMLIKTSQSRWDKGDIILIDDSHYKISSGPETGEYRFSVTAQRVFFTSGPLKGVFARTVQGGRAPSIVIPLAENQQLGLRIAPGDLVGALRN